MSLDTHGSPAPDDATRVAAPGSDVPTLAEGVQLLGDTTGSGYRVPPALARRSDGQTVQLTPLLYQVLDAIDGHRDLADLAQAVSAASGRTVSSDNVRQLVDDTLRPAGLVAMADGSQPELKRANPLLALRFKVGVTDPERTRALTAPFARLFLPVLVVPIVLAFAAIAWWTLVDKGLASATYQAFDHPGLLFLVLAVTVLSAGFHEFGHAAAARYGGATPGVMGAGLYLIWPAFYTDVTDSYRLGRAGRIRTDLGGLYFNAIVVVGTQVAWFLTRDDALLLLVATQVLQMLRQLMPVVRFDGYHVLADTTGIPDLFHWIGPVLVGLLPWRWKTSKARVLKPWARVVITAWVLAVVPMLAFALVTMVMTLPRIVGTAWAASRAQASSTGHAWGSGDVIAALAHGLAAVVVLLPLAAGAILLFRLGRGLLRSLWRRTSGRPVRRSVAVLLIAALVAGLAWSWWPRPGHYAPIKPWERGSLLDAVALARPPAQLGVGSQGHARVVWAADHPVPTRDHPQLAVVLVPHDPASAQSTDLATAPVTDPTTDPSTDPTDVPTTESTTAPAADPTVVPTTTPDADPSALPSTAPTTAPTTAPSSGPTPPPSAPATTDPSTWVFPVDLPLAPGVGDNQAVAVNSTDDTVVYDTAFALVWEDGGDASDPNDNTNQAYALANCDGCAAVSVAFQVVLVVGQTSAAVPENISVAVSSGCVGCLTYALAVQLFVTLDGPLDETQTSDLNDLWSQIQDYGQHVADVPLSDLQSQLDDYQQQVLAIVHPDPISPGATDTPSPTDSPSDSPTVPGETPTESPTESPSDVPSETTSEVPSETPSPSPTVVPTDGTSPTEAPIEEPTTTPTEPTSSPSPAPSTTPTSTATP